MLFFLLLILAFIVCYLLFFSAYLWNKSGKNVLNGLRLNILFTIEIIVILVYPEYILFQGNRAKPTFFRHINEFSLHFT